MLFRSDQEAEAYKQAQIQIWVEQLTQSPELFQALQTMSQATQPLAQTAQAQTSTEA